MTEPKQTNKRKMSGVVFAVKILFSAAAIAWLVWTIEWGGMIEQLEDVRWPVFAVGLLASAFSLLPGALRWQGIAAGFGYSISFAQSLRGYLLGAFFNTFLPTGRAGDVFRGLLVARHYGYSPGGLTATVLVERIVGLVASLVVVIAASLAYQGRMSVMRGVALSAAALLLGAVVVLGLLSTTRLRAAGLGLVGKLPFLRLRAFSADMVDVLTTPWKRPGLFLPAAVYSLCIHATLIVSGILMATAVPGFETSWVAFTVVIPLIFVAALLPSIGGYGVREAGYIISFGWFGVSNDAAAVFAIFQLLYLWAIGLIGAGLFITGGRAVTERGGVDDEAAEPAGGDPRPRSSEGCQG